jgi:uncharacterized protein
MLVARSTDKLQSLANELAQAHTISARSISADLGVPGAGHALAKQLANDNVTIDVLVNNAGFADFGVFHEADSAKLDAMILLNIATLTELMRDLLARARTQRGVDRSILPGAADGRVLRHKGLRSFAQRGS